jgi:hypothetical protein
MSESEKIMIRERKVESAKSRVVGRSWRERERERERD